jgi:hypothetical protein
VISAESLLIRILRRAREVFLEGRELFCSPPVRFFLSNEIKRDDLEHDPEILQHFSRIDDFDIFTAIKVWADDRDPILSFLCRSLANRVLYRIEIQKQPFSEQYVDEMRQKVMKKMDIHEDHLDYFVFEDRTSSYAYDPFDDIIGVMLKSGKVMEFTEASEEFDLTVLTRPVVKHILGYPKIIGPVDN